MKTKLILFTLLAIASSGRVIAQVDSVQFEKTQSILIDGGIQDISKGGIDKSATGQLGFRSENIFGMFEIKFTALSSANEVLSSDIKSYSTYILNPYNSQSGFDAFYVSFLRRSFSRKASFVNYLRFLYSKKIINSEQYDAIIASHQLERYTVRKYRIGYMVDADISNFTWVNSSSVKMSGNIIAINPYLLFNYRASFLENNIDLIAGAGPSFRFIAGDIGNNKDFISSVLGNRKTFYPGAQLTARASISGFYAKANYALYSGNVEGLTHGQFYLSIGIQANLGNKSNAKAAIRDILRDDLGLKLR